ncbi:hypothetical protein [Halostagnicola kamekurae]|uniref:Uncharacterized protein n=1 Tax=Halostagnicola kamekurae TaxID=619731 RepID=A0A1I6P8T8_9EURY|nr:hypothetical protein [Halostagnicola kamekurae]SFS36604.1 hypothetical protein SAMN04488556_0398 [Halostagnicola kamekurae]
MRALSHCDFCGADAAGTFELLPPELEPTEDEQRRVVLCQACSAQLEELLKPLLARAGSDRVDDPVNTESDAETESASPVETDDDSRSADATDLETADGEESNADTAGRPAVIDVSGAKTEPNDNETGADADSTDRGITLERTADEDSAAESSTADSPAANEDDTDPSTDEGDADSSTEEDQDVDSTVGDAGSANAGGSADDSGTSPPRGYGKVIRLLRNREFPMARSDVETLAAGAYDLESHTVEEIVEYALEDGEFEQEGEQLVRS